MTCTDDPLMDVMHEMPPAPFALLDLVGELVDERLDPVSNEEVYLHHAVSKPACAASHPESSLFCSADVFMVGFGFQATNRSAGAQPTTCFGGGLPEAAAVVFTTGCNGPGRPDAFVGQWHIIRTEGERRRVTRLARVCSAGW